jgi:hypothetical protein
MLCAALLCFALLRSALLCTALGRIIMPRPVESSCCARSHHTNQTLARIDAVDCTDACVRTVTLDSIIATIGRSRQPCRTLSVSIDRAYAHLYQRPSRSYHHALCCFGLLCSALHSVLSSCCARSYHHAALGRIIIQRSVASHQSHARSH